MPASYSKLQRENSAYKSTNVWRIEWSLFCEMWTYVDPDKSAQLALAEVRKNKFVVGQGFFGLCTLLRYDFTLDAAGFDRMYH